MINMSKKIIVPLLIVTSALLSLNCSGGNDNSQKLPDTGAQASTINVPVFTAQDIGGRWQSADQWLGKQPVVINFWGTWCPPCRREIPDLVKLYAEYKNKGVEIISLAVNDTPDKVNDFAAANNMGWVMLMAQDQIMIDYKATTGVPTTIFIDKNGNEVTRFIGMRDYETLKTGFDAIL